MDFHALSRRDLQALAKRNGVRANMSNAAMADALAALPAVDGIEEYVQQPVAEPTPAAEPEKMEPAAEEEKEAPAEEEEEEHEKQEISPHEVIVLNDSEVEAKDLKPDQDEEKAPARRATRLARVKPVAAPATRRRAAARKTETGAAAAEAVQARATRGRSQGTVAEDEGPKARRTSRRAVAKKTSTEQEDEEKGTQGDVSSDEGGDGAPQNEEQNAPVEEHSQEDEGETEKEVAAAVAVPARATRARSQRTVMSVTEEEVPKARRALRRAVAKKNSTEQEDEEKATQGDVSDEGVNGAAQNEEQNAPVEEQSREDEGETEKEDAAEAAPARATRARRQRTGTSAAEEEAPKARRTSRRAVARKTGTDHEEQEKGTQGDTGATVPAAVSSDDGGNDAEEMEAAMDARNEEQFAAAQAEKEDAAAEAVPARATRSRRQRTVVSAAEEEAPKAKRTSRRTAARKASTKQEEEEKATQGDVSSDVEVAVPAPVSSDEGGDDAEDMEVAMDAQNQEQNELVEQQSQEEEGVVADIPAPVEEEPPVAEDCMVGSSVQEQLGDVQQCEGSPVVFGLAEQEGSYAFQNDAVSSEGIHHADEDTEMVPVDEVPQTPLKSSEATEEVNFTSNVGHDSEEIEVPTSAEVLQSPDKAIDEQEDMAADVAEDMAGHTSEEDEVQAEDEPPVAEDVDSSVQEPLVHVQQCEEIHLAGEDTEMVPVNELQRAMLESGVAKEEVDCTRDAGEENEDCMVEEDVDSSVQEPLVVDVQQCESTEEIHLGSEDTEMVPVLECGESTEEVDFTSNVSYASEEIEEVLQNAAKAVEVLQSADKAIAEQEAMAADEVPRDTNECVKEEAVVATDEMPQSTESMDQGVVEVVTVDNLSEATVTDDEAAVKENGFTADLIDVSIEEEAAVTADEMPLSSATMDENVQEEVVTVENLWEATATDGEGAVKLSGSTTTNLPDVSVEEKEVVAADGMPTMEENVEEEVTADNLSQATVTDDVVAVMDLPVEEEGEVAADEIPNSSATMKEDVEEEVVEELPQATVADDECAIKESVFSCGLAVLSVDEEGMMAADEMQLSSPTMNKSVEEVLTVDNPSQATVTDYEWAVKESALAGECTPVVDTARDFSDHIASPISANVFEDATKSLSMDSITIEPMASEPADVPLCMYSSSSGKNNASESAAVQRENEVKEGGNEPEAAFGKIRHCPLSIRKLRMAVAQENEADGVPLCIFSSSGGEENSAEPMLVEREKEVNECEALGSLSRRKLRTNLNEKVAVPQENEVKEGEKSSVPLDKLSLRKLRIKLRETLNAQKNIEPKRVALGRLDENVC